MSGEYKVVTFIGGPMDLTRRAIPVTEHVWSCLESDHTQEQLLRESSRVRPDEVPTSVRARVVTYHIVQVSPRHFIGLLF